MYNQRYEKRVTPSIYGVNKFKGFEISDISAPEITLTYLIEQEHRSWGIKGISLYDIQGPSEMEIEIDYYTTNNPNNGDTKNETITLQLDWSKVETEENKCSGIISVDDDVDIDLNEDFSIKKIMVEVNTL